MDTVVTLGHNLGKDLAGFVSGVGCQVHPFKQLYTIRVLFKDVTGTTVYAFLPNKCQDTYRELFQSIADNCRVSNLQLQDHPSYHRTV
jgi:hypothetical protein